MFPGIPWNARAVITTVGWDPPQPGTSATGVWLSLKYFHHSNISLQLSVRFILYILTLLCKLCNYLPLLCKFTEDINLQYISYDLMPSLTKNFITTCYSVYIFTLLSAILSNGLWTGAQNKCRLPIKGHSCQFLLHILPPPQD